MSTSIDQRVVEMRFDNAQFESGVKTSLSTLDKLKQALKLDGFGKGLDDLSTKANHFDMSGMNTAVESVSQKFSALETIAIGALLRIGNQAADTGIKLVKSLSVDNITAGWDKFEKKTTSVATLVAQGFDQKDVNAQMERLNWFTDETSYNFTDMVDNIGKFTAAGKDLGQSVTAMEGIANWAALSGQNATTASRAMYQLSQAMGKGALKYDDWKSIQNANMDTREFRENALAVAESLGKIKKVGDKAGETIYQVGKKTYTLQEMFTSDALTKTAWFDDEVMMNTFGKYASAVDKVYEAVASGEYDTASEAIAAMGDKVDAFGIKAFEAAQSARTWTDVVDSVKDAVSTGWMNTFEIIVGDATEATRIFTAMANELWEIFASGGEERNEWLKYWADEENGGRKALLEGFSNLYYDLKMIFEPIKLGLREAFGLGEDVEDTAKVVGPVLVKLSEGFRDFTRNLAGDGSHYQKIKEAARGIFTGVRTIGEGFLSILKILSPISIPLKSLANLLLDLAVRFGAWTERISAAAKQSETLQTIYQNVSKAVKDFCLVLAYLIDNFDEVIAVGQEIWGIFVEAFTPAFQEARKSFDEFIKPLTDFVHAKFGNAFERLWASISSFDFSGTIQVLDEIFTRIKNSQKVQTVITAISTAIQFLSNHIQKAWKNIKEFVNSVSTAFSKGGILGAINEVIDRFKSGFTNIKNTIREFISDNSFLNFFQNIGKGSDDAVGPLERITNAIKGFVSQLTPGKLAVVGFSVAILALAYNTSKMFSAFSNLANAGADFLGIFKSFGKKNNVLRDLAITIGVLAGSLYLLSRIPAAKLKGATNALLKLVGAAGLIAVLLTVLSKIDTKAAVGSQLKTIAASMIAFAGAAAIMALTLERIQDLKINGGLLIKLGLLVGVIGVLALIGKKAGGFTGSYQAAVTIVAFAGAIALVVDALVKMTSVDAPDLKDSVLALVGVMTALAVLSRGIGSIGIISAVGLIALVWALEKALPKLEALAGGDYKNIKKMLQDNIEIMVILADVVAGMMLIASLTGGGIEKFGKGMIRLAGALAVMVGVVYLLGKMDAGVAKRGTKALTAILGMFAVLELVSGISSRIAGGDKAFTKGIMTVSFASLLLVGAVAALGMLDPAQVKRGELALAGVLGMLAVFTVVSAVSARIAKDNKGGGLKGVTAIIAGVAALAIELIALSFVPWEDLKRGMIALAVVVGLLSAAVLAMSQLKPVGVLTFIETIVLLGTMTAALYILSNQPWENMIASAASLAILAVGLSGALELLALAGAAAGPALIGIGLLDIFLVDLAGMVALMGTFNIDAINKGIDVLNTLGFGLGAAIGNFVSGIGVGLSNGLPAIGTNLSMFAITSKPFFDMMTGTDISNIGSGVKGLADGLLAITANNFLETVVAGLTGVGSMEKFGQDLAAFGSAIVQYSDTVSGKINEEAITSSVNAGKMLTELNDAIPNSGGVLAELIGDNTFATFKVGLVGFGRALVEYSGVVSGKIDETAVESSVNAGKMLTELNDNIPNSGGVLASFLGDNTWSTFAEGLAAFGRALVAFSGIVAGKIDDEAISAAANAGSMMAKLNTEIPNSGGAIAFFTGDNDFSSFGKNLVDFGNSIVSFATTTNGINATQMSGVISVTKALVEIASSVSTTGAGQRGMFGGNQFESFGKNLTDFAKQIQKFSTELSSISADQLSATAASFKSLVNTLSDIANVDISGVATFSTSLESIGHLGVQNFIMTFTNSEESVQTAISSFVGYFINDLTAKATEFNTSGSDAIGNVVSGMDTKSASDAPVAGTNLVTEFIGGITSELTQLEQAGADAVNGFISGVSGNIGLVRSIGVSMGAEFIAGVREETGWNSPWTTMIEAGKDAAIGLQNGVDSTSGDANKSGHLLGYNFIEGFRDETGWHSPPEFLEKFFKATGVSSQENAKEQQDAVTKSGNMLGSYITDGVNQFVDKTGKALTGSKLGIIEQAGKAYTESGGDILDTSKKVYEAITGTAEDSSEAIEKTTDTVKKADEQITKTDSTVKAVSNTVKSTTQTVKDAKTTLEETKEASENYFDVMSFGEDVVEAFRERYGAAFAELGDTTPLEASKAAVEALALATYEASIKSDESLSKAAKSSEESTSKLDKIREAFGKMRESLTSTISGQMDIFEEFDRKTELTGQQLLKNMQSQISGITQWSVQLQELAARGIDDGLLKKLSEMGPRGYEYVNAFTQMTASELQQASQLFQTSLQVPGAAAVQIMASYAYTGTQAMSNFSTAITQSQATVNTATQSVARNGATALNTVANSVFNDSGRNIDSVTSKSIASNENMPVGASETMGDHAASALDEAIVPGFTSAGDNAVNGLVGSLESEAAHARVAAAAASLAQTANSAITSRAGFDEASPSKKWYQFGAYAVEGLTNGIDKFGKSAASSATNVGAKASDALSKAISQISTAGLDDDMQPVITPVLDLSEIQSGLGVMHSMFGNSAPYISGVTSKIGSVSLTRNDSSILANAIDGMSQGNNNTYNITINTQPGQNAREIADMTLDRLNNQIRRRKAAFA